MNNLRKLAIITTHPIQYNSPFFRLLSEQKDLRLKVFFTLSQSSVGQQYDPGFGKTISWDIPLLEGFGFTFVNNTSRNPGSHHFRGINNPTLIKEINQFKPDVILIYGWAFQSHLSAMRYFNGKIPVWFRGDSTLLDEKQGFSLRKIFRRIFLKWVYRHIDKAFFVGIENKKYFLAHGMTEDQLIFAPHAIDNDRFSEPDAVFQQKAFLLKGDLHIPNNACVFLFAGKLESKKNPILLLEAFMQIESPNQRLIMVGNGPLVNLLKKIAETDIRVIFIDFQNQLQMPIVYRLADIFVLPSQGPGETWGLAINEAMACGKPVIVSSRCGANADLVNHETGWVFESGNQFELKTLLERCILKPKEIRENGIAAKEYIKKYSYNEMIESVIQLMFTIK